MTRAARLAVGVALVIAIGCAGATVNITPEQRVLLEKAAAGELCARCLADDKCSKNVEAAEFCALLTATPRVEPIDGGSQ